jgi:hypothetical protein
MEKTDTLLSKGTNVEKSCKNQRLLTHREGFIGSIESESVP